MNYVQLLFLLLIAQLSNACPTCIGRIDKSMPPFFSAEFDEHYNVYAQVPVDGESDTESSVEEEA